MKRWLVILAGLVFLSPTLCAQVRIVAQPDKIYLGEQFSVTMTVNVKLRDRPVVFPVLPDSIPHIDFLEITKWDSIRRGEYMVYEQTLRLTSFDSGRWAFPSLPFEIGEQLIASDTVVISVLPVTLRSEDYHDIHDIAEVANPSPFWRQWLPVIVGILLILLVAIYLVRRKKARPPIQNITGDPYTLAMEALSSLERNAYHRRGEMREFYDQLYAIFRRYWSGVIGYSVWHTTTDELIIRIKSSLDTDAFFGVAEVLRICIAVRFARYQSSAEEADRSLERMKKAIESIHKKRYQG